MSSEHVAENPYANNQTGWTTFYFCFWASRIDLGHKADTSHNSACGRDAAWGEDKESHPGVAFQVCMFYQNRHNMVFLPEAMG